MCKPVVSGSNSPEIFDPVKHPLDGISVAVEIRREAILPASVALWRNIRCGTFIFDLLPDGISIIAFITMQDCRGGELVKQNVGSGAVGNMAAGQQEPDGAAEAVGQSMDSGCSSTT